MSFRVGRGWLAWFALVLPCACAARPSARGAVLGRAVTQSAVLPRGPDYRFVPGADSSDAVNLPGGRVGIVGSIRQEVALDGSVTRAEMGGVDLMGGMPVPQRFGGGFLFWNADGLYRAKTFTGPLEAITAVPTNAIGVAFGHDSILLFTPDDPPRAFRLDAPGAVPLSPPGAVDIAGADDARVVALDAVGRALASTDGGQRWQDVSSALPGRAHGVLEDGQRVGFSLDGARAAWLKTDGQFETEPFEDWKAEPRPRESDLERLERAVNAGVALPEQRALVGDANGIRVVELATGRADSARPVGTQGMNCHPLSVDDDGVVTCTSYTGQGSSRIVVSHALSSAPKIEKTFERADVNYYMAQGRLLLETACSGAPNGGVACMRSPGGTWRDLDVRPLLDGRAVLGWVLGEAGAASALVVDSRTSRLALLDPDRKRATPWDKSVQELGPFLRQGARVTNLRLLQDGSVHGFVSTGALRVSATGAVQLPGRRFATVAAYAVHALARDPEGRLWQTSNDGSDWQEVLAPPELAAPAAAVAPGAQPQMHCTALGCILPHSSGAGHWLRIGWPTTPPAPVQHAASTDAEPQPPPLPPPLVGPARPTLSCQRLAAKKLPAAKKPPATIKAPVPPPPRDLEINYFDTFYPPEALRSSVNRPLRATLLAPRGDKNAHAQVSGRYRQVFEPKGSEQKFSDTLANWLLRADEARADRGTARPVLSPRAGMSDGVLLDHAPFSAWVGAGHAVPLRADCKAQSAFVDERQKLFFACASSHGATRIEDSSGQVLLRWQPSIFARDKRRASMSFFPPGKSSFETPDAIAVGPNGQLALLRLSSGSQPATRDNPAWLLTESGAPVALAPWSSLELASSPACAQQPNAFRALIQTSTAWLDVDGANSASDEQANMSALVRWSPERVCLEAIEVGSSRQSARLVARFVGAQRGAAWFDSGQRWSRPEPTTCTFTTAAAEAR